MTEMARTGQGDAFALSHDSFAGLLPKLPGARVLPGHFQQTGIAVAVPKGRPAALKLASGLIENAKKSGLVRRALDAAGFKDAEVAPLDGLIAKRKSSSGLAKVSLRAYLRPPWATHSTRGQAALPIPQAANRSAPA